MPPPPPLSTLEHCEVSTAKGRFRIPCELRHSARARHIRLSISSRNQARLTLPPHSSLEDGLRFVQKKADWLLRALSRQPPLVPLLQYLKENPSLSLLGRACALSILPTEGASRIRFDSESATAALRLNPLHEKDAALCPLLHNFARSPLQTRARQLANECGQSLDRISVRNQKTRWGSCSHSGSLSLNWRLILLPPELQDHILYHELAHLSQLNHSPAFWAQLTRYDPHARAHNRQIRDCAPRLMALARD